MRLVLASKSPRRIELLGMLGVPFAVLAPECGEDARGDAAARVQALARRKAGAAASALDEPAWVLGADTLVEKDGAIFGKPRDEADARRMLRELSGGWHNVHTGVALLDGRDGGCVSAIETARVRFAPMSDAAIGRYVESGEPMDKAGAYGIQGGAGAYIAGIEGDWYAVVGLPLCRVRTMLEEAGILR